MVKLGIPEAAELLSVSEKTLYRWIRRGILPVYRINDSYRFNRSELLAWAISRRLNVSDDVFHDSLKVTGPIPTLEEAVQRGGIHYRLSGQSKEEILRSLVECVRLSGETDPGYHLSLILARESLAPTGVGNGFAIPQLIYPNSLETGQPSISIAFLEYPINYDSLDAVPVHTLLSLFSPSLRGYHFLLNRIYFALRDTGFQESLRARAGREELLGHLRRIESSLRKSG